MYIKLKSLFQLNRKSINGVPFLNILIDPYVGETERDDQKSSSTGRESSSAAGVYYLAQLKSLTRTDIYTIWRKNITTTLCTQKEKFRIYFLTFVPPRCV